MIPFRLFLLLALYKLCAGGSNCVSESIRLKLEKIPTGSCCCCCCCSLKNYSLRLKGCRLRPVKCRSSGCKISSPSVFFFVLFVFIRGQLRHDSKRGHLFRVAHCFHFGQPSQQPVCIHLYYLLLLVLLLSIFAVFILSFIVKWSVNRFLLFFFFFFRWYFMATAKWKWQRPQTFLSRQAKSALHEFSLLFFFGLFCCQLITVE